MTSNFLLAEIFFPPDHTKKNALRGAGAQILYFKQVPLAHRPPPGSGSYTQ